jgi:hypothetical protein
MYFDSAVERSPTVRAVSSMSAGSRTLAAAAAASAYDSRGSVTRRSSQE